MKDENTLYWIWLSERCGVASKNFGQLMSKYESPFDIYRLDDEETERIEGIAPTLKIRLTDKSLDSAYSILKYCKQKKIDIVSYSDERYPARLRGIEDPPALLYVIGRMPDMNNRLCVGMVGTRKMSEYGRESAYKISYDLASANTVIVSGMALGVDGVSACGALASGGDTVAVLGCGISVVYPKEHEKLMREIAKNGAVVTEYPPTERPHGYNFPKRNRIISGMCQGVLVIEGSASSGALITAKRAVDQGRDLFALPGKINESNSDGPNELIKNGAHVALGADDIISHYDFLYHDCINYKGLRKAKDGGVPVETALRRYGVASVYRKGTAYRPDVVTEDPTASAERISVKTADDAQQVTPAIKAVAAEALAGLDEVSRKVFEAMPIDRAVSSDMLPIEGVDIGAVMTAFTLLEINGLIEALPGGMYLRK